MKYKKQGTELVIVFDENEDNISLLDFFHQIHLSKKTIHLLQQNKEYMLNGHYTSINTHLKKNDVLTIQAYQSGIDFKPQAYPLKIVYEDDILCVVNKPKNTIIHPENKDGINTLCNYVAYYYQTTKQDYPIRYLHRLDRDTTGLVMFCKCSLLQPYFDYMIADKKIKKHYLALIEGHLNQESLTVHQAIGQNRHDKQKMMVSAHGKSATTHFKTIKTMSTYSLIECLIDTGRKHQIRVHLQHLGHPILGDPLYGHQTKLIDRLALHAYRLQLIHPLTHKKIDIVCDVNQDMKKLL